MTTEQRDKPARLSVHRWTGPVRRLGRVTGSQEPAGAEGPPNGRAGSPAFRGRHTALAPTTWLIVAVLLVAANLRPAVTSFGAVLDEVRGSLHTSSAWASVVTALPTLCFGLAGFLAPALARRRGLARAIGLSVGLIAVGILARVLDGSVTVLAGTFVACAGIAICNVLIPVVIKESYPHRIGLLTGLYTGTLQTAAALAAFLTPPLNAALGGWRPALGSWSGLAVLALFGWVLAARHGHAETTERPVARTEPVSALLRNPLAWFVTLFFGLQATFAYAVMGWMPQVLMGAGVSRGTAGVMMAMMSVLGAPLSLLVVPYVTRRRSQSGWIAGFTLVGSVGVLGLLIAPSAAPWLWAVCVGIGMGVFALAVALIPLRTRTVADTRRLSTMTQSVGYLIAVLGPLLFGTLHGITGGWTASLALLLVVIAAQVVVGVLAGRPRYV